MEITLKQHLEALNRYICLFEEIIENHPDLIDRDNFDDYRETVGEYNTLSPDRPYNANGILMILDDIENELPFEQNPDEARDWKYDR